MGLLGFLLPLCVFIGFSDCSPIGKITRTYTISEYSRVNKTNVKFPHSSTTAVRSPSGNWAKDRNTTSRIAEEQFVFPEDYPKPPMIANRFKPIPSSKVPPCAKIQGATFCEEIDGYPGNYLEIVFQNVVDDYQGLLGTDEIRATSILQRFDDTANESPLCNSMEQVVFPKTAKTKDDKWLFIVNHGAYVQGVRIEKCHKNGDNGEQKCQFTDSFPNGYKTTCKQKYIYRKLVAISEEGKPITDTFQLPSCCSCSVISTGIANRLGGSRGAPKTTGRPTSKPAV